MDALINIKDAVIQMDIVEVYNQLSGMDEKLQALIGLVVGVVLALLLSAYSFTNSSSREFPRTACIL
jgi:xanthine/uracil permease